MTEIGLRLRETQKPLLSRPDRPLSYLRWLLTNAVPDEPPAQIAAAAAATARELARTRAEQWELRARTAAAARSGSGLQEARRVAAAIAEQRRQVVVDARRE